MRTNVTPETSNRDPQRSIAERIDRTRARVNEIIGTAGAVLRFPIDVGAKAAEETVKTAGVAVQGLAGIIGTMLNVTGKTWQAFHEPFRRDNGGKKAA